VLVVEESRLVEGAWLQRYKHAVFSLAFRWPAYDSLLSNLVGMQSTNQQTPATGALYSIRMHRRSFMVSARHSFLIPKQTLPPLTHSAVDCSRFADTADTTFNCKFQCLQLLGLDPIP